MNMAFRERMIKKLCCSFCDKPDLNRRACRLRKCFAEVEHLMGGKKCCPKK